MFGRLSGWELIIILVILLLFFGARKLPDLARSIGASAKEVRKGFDEERAEDEDTSSKDSSRKDASGGSTSMRASRADDP